jgi:hypothetical protein
MQNVHEPNSESQVGRKGATPQLFDVKAACDHLKSIGVSAATVSSTRTIFAQVPHIRIGKRFYVSKESLERWIDQRQRRR